MNISNQLKNYRKKLNISQEEFAEVVHVSRQTISNWENDKSYPDIQSLVLISEYFKISLDELVKGDVASMKNQLDLNEMNKYTYGMLIGWGLVILSVLLIKSNKVIGLIAFFISCVIMLWSAFKVEKIKKDKNLKTYKEIVEYMESGVIPKAGKESKKYFLKQLLCGIVCGIITAILVFIILKLF